MLTDKQKRNIEEFSSLTPVYQRVFRHRLRKRCQRTLYDFKFVLLHSEELKLKSDNFVYFRDLDDVLDLLRRLR